LARVVGDAIERARLSLLGGSTLRDYIAAMKPIILVGLGGCIGAIARFKLGGMVLHHTTDWRFPLSTFAVNVLGCFVAGIVAGAVERHGLFSADTRTFLFAGILGGFTTFSAFGVETVALLRRGELTVALAYVALSVVCGVALLWLGMTVIPHRAA
jgi:fluoride exporter